MTIPHEQTPPEMSPGMRIGKTPPFYEIGEYFFQDLCRDLFAFEPSIATCEYYGTRGQTQFGIDLYALRKHDDGIEVGQCKCYKNFSPAEIGKASKPFFRHWTKRWSKLNVKRYILFIACDLTSRQCIDKIKEQKNKFTSIGVSYEVWSAPTIKSRLGPHPSIVSSYCYPQEHWIKEICGIVPPPLPSIVASSARVSAILASALDTRIEDMAVRISGTVAEKLELMREAWREGRKDEAERWVENTKTDSVVWPSLSPETKANILRFQACLVLDTGRNIPRAKQLADEALGLEHPNNQVRLRALLALREVGPDAAIVLLTDLRNIDSLNLRAAVLLEAGRIEESLDVLGGSFGELGPNAETMRLFAHAHLLKKNLSQARLDIGKALELKPRWEAVCLAAGIVYYFSALSPAVLQDQIASWPEPVDWAFVKRDDESLAHLRKAANIFRELAESPGKQTEEHQVLEAWHLACLANDPERSQQVTDYCRAILRANPSHPFAIIWVVARSLDVDLTLCEGAILTAAAEGKATLPQIIALLSFYLLSRKIPEAIALLSEKRAFFKEQRADSLWSLWHAQVLIASDDPDAGMKEIEESGPVAEARNVRTLALQAKGEKTGDLQPLIKHLEACFEDTQDPRYLYECCQQKARQGDWAYVADRSERLIEVIGTEEAVRLSAIATYNDKRLGQCLRLLNDHQNLFQGRRLPTTLRLLRIYSQRGLGILPEAIEDADDLVREKPTTENIIALTRLCFDMGDLKRMALAARRLKGRSDVPVQQLLPLCQHVLSEDLPLAKSFWKEAVRRGLPENTVFAAITLGSQLGFEKELAPLWSRATALGKEGRGGIRLGTQEDIVIHVKGKHEHIEKAYDLYRSGKIPIHTFAEQVDRPLANFYHRVLSDNASSNAPNTQFALMIRHGGRLLQSDFPADVPKWHLILDVTAALLGEHLRILDYVESYFAPLRIPGEIVPSLIGMRQEMEPYQPKRIIALRQIIGLAERGAFQVKEYKLPEGYGNRTLVEEVGEGWVAAFVEALSTNGYVLDLLPIRKKGSVELAAALPEDANQHIVNCRAVLEALQLQGQLSSDGHTNALESLGTEGQVYPSAVIPRKGSQLHCLGIFPEILAEANLLHIACEQFLVHVEQSEIKRIRAELLENEQQQTVGRWLETLIERIRKGIDQGLYQVIPNIAGPDDKDEEESHKSPDARSLETLLRFEPGEDDALWVDDRLLNSFSFRMKAPIIGINEIMKGLVCHGALSVADYYQRVHQLRAGNARFIPLEIGEILHHLLQAKIENNQIVETRELVVLRRHIASCLLQGDALQRPPMPEGSPNPHGEVAFLIGLGRATMDSLKAIWENKDRIETECIFRSEWLLDNLYLDYLGLLAVTKAGAPELDARHRAALGVTALIISAYGLDSRSSGNQPSRRRSYLVWLSDRVIRKRFTADPSLPAAIADVIKRYFVGLDEQGKEHHLPKGAFVLQNFFSDLPEPIQKELTRDVDFMSAMGFKFTRVITIDDLKFDGDEFFRAAEGAINGREATIISMGSGAKVVFQPVEGVGLAAAFRFHHPLSGITVTIGNDELALLVDSPTKREAILRFNRNWFDCSNVLFEEAVARIATIENPRYRIEELDPWRKSSASEFYARLHHKIAGRESMKFSDLVPTSGEGLLRHYRFPTRLESSQDFKNLLECSAQALTKEEGLETAITRLVGFPVPLPSTIITAVRALSGQMKRNLIKKLLTAPASPLSRIHMLHVLLQIGDETPAFLRLAGRMCNSLLHTDVKSDLESFLALLEWTSREFELWKDTWGWSHPVRLAVVWGHTHRLFATFVSAGGPPGWIKDIVDSAGQRFPVRIFGRDPEYRIDIANPRHVGRTGFLLAGLSYALEGKTKHFLRESWREILKEEAFPNSEVEGVRLPDFSLLLDTSQARNGLGSFLGGDREGKLLPLLGEDVLCLSRTSLKGVVDTAIGQLANREDGTFPWIQLSAVLGGLPPYEDVIERLTDGIRQTDFVDIFKKNIIDGTFAISVASLQALNINNGELCRHLKEQVLKISKLLADQYSAEIRSGTAAPDKELQRKACLTLLNSALNISVAIQSEEKAVQEFVDIVMQIINTWPEIVAEISPIIQRLWEDLPPAYAQPLATLLVLCRSR